MCFKVISADTEEGEPCFRLSRRAAQQECSERYISRLRSGDVIPARVTHLERFGCFVDIGCGIPSLIPIDAISVSRISHPNDRFYNGQSIYAAVRGFEGGRVLLTHKELLGTWLQNASRFEVSAISPPSEAIALVLCELSFTMPKRGIESPKPSKTGLTAFT